MAHLEMVYLLKIVIFYGYVSHRKSLLFVVRRVLSLPTLITSKRSRMHGGTSFTTLRRLLSVAVR